MYDSNISSRCYNGFRKTIINIINGDDMKTNPHKLSDKIYKKYCEGDLSSSQYDHLMQDLQEYL